jgi:hypothetical protein
MRFAILVKADVHIFAIAEVFSPHPPAFLNAFIEVRWHFVPPVLLPVSIQIAL